jgi:hypothetical protein
LKPETNSAANVGRLFLSISIKLSTICGEIKQPFWILQKGCFPADDSEIAEIFAICEF